MECIGTNGVLTIEFSSWDEYTISIYHVGKSKWTSFAESTTRDDMFAKEDTAFLNAVMGKDTITCGLDEGLRSLKVVQTAQNKCSA